MHVLLRWPPPKRYAAAVTIEERTKPMSGSQGHHLLSSNALKKTGLRQTTGPLQQISDLWDPLVRSTERIPPNREAPKMPIFTGSKSTAINSPRHLTIRHARREAANNSNSPSSAEPGGVAAQPLDEKVSSFWAPGLKGGLYNITVKQTVVSSHREDEPLHLEGTQSFRVDAPQFSLPSGSVYSVYPPPGHAEEHRILPHVVLSDPHLPWERQAIPLADEADKDRTRTPWMALLTFNHDELRPAPPELVKLGCKSMSTLAVNTTIDSIANLSAVASPISTIPGGIAVDPAKTRADFIFLQPGLFLNLFSAYDKDNNRSDEGFPDVTKFQHLAHVRTVRTAGMAVAGVEDSAVFSVVVDSRSGPLDNTAPVTVSVHLVSLDGVQGMGKTTSDKTLVALCSLHSWNYTVRPAGWPNVYDEIMAIKNNVGLLRPPQQVMRSVNSSSNRPGDLASRLAQRLGEGFSMVRHRLQTGEQTVALYRGPLTPTPVATNKALTRCSNSGQSLSILDPEMGILDISYSVAWQLGRTLALGDAAFTAALGRFRIAIHQQTMDRLKLELLQEGFPQRGDVIRRLKETVKHVDAVHKGSDQVPGHRRWYRAPPDSQQYPVLGFHTPEIAARYLDTAKQTAEALALSETGSLYDETNDPVSTDWMVILAWVKDRLFLAGVPAHNLISDPSHLEDESLRFFHIDPNWIDCLIDGALSLANHMGQDRDRVAIKHIINQHIEQRKPSSIRGFPDQTPQIPRYGFYLRSHLVSRFPDLKVTVKPEWPVGSPLLRHEIVADGVMLGLLEGHPGFELQQILFTQPSHQQRFAVGESLSTDGIKVNIRPDDPLDDEDYADARRHNIDTNIAINRRPSAADNVFIWDAKTNPTTSRHVRMLNLPHFADEQARLCGQVRRELHKAKFEQPLRVKKQLLDIYQDQLRTAINDRDRAKIQSNLSEVERDIRFIERVMGSQRNPSSALLATQLLDPAHQLAIQVNPSHADDPDSRAPRTLKMMTVSEVEPPPPSPPPKRPGKPDAPLMTIPAAAVLQSLRRPHDSSHRTQVLSQRIVPRSRTIQTRPSIQQELALLFSQPWPSLPLPSPLLDPQDTPLRFRCEMYNLNHQDPSLPSDLIISMSAPTAGVQHSLSELTILMPLGTRADEAHTLVDHYNGPGARVIDSQRFNIVLSSLTKNQNRYLVIRLLARNPKGSVLLGLPSGSSGPRLSFILSLMSLRKFKTDDYDAPFSIAIMEYYNGDREPTALGYIFLQADLNENRILLNASTIDVNA